MQKTFNIRKTYPLDSFFKEITSSKKSLRVLFFTHRQADPDAMCAAYGLSRILEKIAKKEIRSSIITPQGVTLLGKSVSSALEIHTSEDLSPKDIMDSDAIIALDVGQNELLEPYLKDILESKASKFLIDHHSSREQDLFRKTYLKTEATSTCELIALGFKDDVFDQSIARALLVGLLFDSQHLSLATESTLEATLKLVRRGARIDEAKQVLKSRPVRSEVIARLKSAQRLKFKEIGKYVIAESQVSSFQAAVARMLVEVGADVGIAYGVQNDETRLSIRSTQNFFKETGVNFGDLIKDISKDSSGIVGGGHPTAASLTGTESAETILKQVVERLKKALP
ncbi:MAG: DHH family phosphoesterase [Nitrososphaerales archaeon]